MAQRGLGEESKVEKIGFTCRSGEVEGMARRPRFNLPMAKTKITATSGKSPTETEDQSLQWRVLTLLRLSAAHKAQGIVSVDVVDLCMLRKHMIVV